MAKYVMALDSGTTSNRCILFDESGRIRSVAQKEFIQHFPKPGWVEHDAGEIWSTQLSVAREAMNQIEATAEDIAAIGWQLAMAELAKIRPMEMTMGPVTTGGKKRITRLAPNARKSAANTG